MTTPPMRKNNHLRDLSGRAVPPAITVVSAAHDEDCEEALASPWYVPPARP